MLNQSVAEVCLQRRPVLLVALIFRRPLTCSVRCRPSLVTLTEHSRSGFKNSASSETTLIANDYGNWKKRSRYLSAFRACWTCCLVALWFSIRTARSVTAIRPPMNSLGQDLRGKRWLDVITACLAPRHDDGHEVSLRDGRRLSLATRSLQGGCGQVVLLTDQTDTRRLQEQLARQERLTLMGRMLAARAHQIRTPLAAAMLYAGHLAGERLDAKQTRRFAEKTLSRLQAMEYQVRDMLIFVKGDVPLTARVSVPDLVEALRSAMEPALINYTGSCDWQVDTNPELQLQCNRDALVGAVMNLVTNGIQAMAGSGRLELRLCQADDLRLVITVADDGPGMDQSTLEKVNDVFFSTKPHGTGLGLAVVRAVAQAHQGNLHCAQPRGKDAKRPSVYRYSQPARRNSLMTEHAKHILIVEDDLDLREALCDTLDLAGLRVSGVADGGEALNLLGSDPIDMVISDVNMPGMDRHDLLCEVRRRHPQVPMALITAYGSIGKSVQAMRDGAVDYLVKPFAPEVLVETVRRYMAAPAPLGTTIRSP